ARGERNSFATRTLPAGMQASGEALLRTLNINGPANAPLIHIRPSFRKRSVVLHFREVDGLPAEIQLSPANATVTIRKVTEINSLGEETGAAGSTIRLVPYEVKFIEVEI
ncbi:MAG: hypothetical protein WAO03_05260, partial [Petrimonas mucosa]